MGRLLLLFILVPAVELAILIEIGSRLGTLPTLALIVLTGMLGAFLARRQGLGILRLAQEQMQRGQLPAGALADGIMILVAASLLVTPGVLTDAFGFLLLVPAFRRFVRRFLTERYRRAVEQNRIRVRVVRQDYDGHESVVDVEPDEPGQDFEVSKYRIH